MPYVTIASSGTKVGRIAIVNSQCQDLYTIATMDSFEGVVVNTRLRIGHTIVPGITVASGYLV